jgi:hypothetical protein
LVGEGGPISDLDVRNFNIETADSCLVN